jgi:hypothetical protein
MAKKTVRKQKGLRKKAGKKIRSAKTLSGRLGDISTLSGRFAE